MAKVLIELEFDGDAEHARFIVDNMLDNGAIQDPINDHDCAESGCEEVAGHLHVTGAYIKDVLP